MRFKSSLSILTIALALTACNKSRNPQMQAPPEHFQAQTIEGGQTKSVAEPKVNILFVVDNSGSMKDHQAKLKANIDRFADKFFSNPRIDYKIGVVPVYDRRYLNDTKVYGTAGVRKMNPFGELAALKDKDGQTIDAPPYITRNTPDAKNVLKNTLALGVQWGPEAEESFSPVMEIIANESLNKTKNAGFYDKDAHLVIIFLTDADDVTLETTADSFYQFLLDAKEGNRNKILIAAAIPSSKVSSASCKLDGNGPQYQFPELISVSGAMRADLCSNNFGEKLAALGERVVQRVGIQKITLGFVPDINYTVTYGTKDSDERQVLKRGQDYTFNQRTNTIILNSRLNIQRVEGGEVFVTATPVNMANLRNGRAKPNIISAAATAKR